MFYYVDYGPTKPKNWSPEFFDPYDLHWRSKSKMAAKIFLLLSKTFFVYFLWFFVKFINEHDACLHLFSKFLKKRSKTERVICPWLMYRFQEWVFYSGFLSLKGKLSIFLKYINEQKKLICTSSIYIQNFMIIELFVHELSAFKVEKKYFVKNLRFPFSFEIWVNSGLLLSQKKIK